MLEDCFTLRIDRTLGQHKRESRAYDTVSAVQSRHVDGKIRGVVKECHGVSDEGLSNA